MLKWNNTGEDYPHHSCAHRLFEAQVDRTPDAIAVRFQDQKLTYRDLNSRANRLARHLVSLGVEAEALVAIGVERSLDLVIAILAVVKSGGAYLPLDPAHPVERRVFGAQACYGLVDERHVHAGQCTQEAMIDTRARGAR